MKQAKSLPKGKLARASVAGVTAARVGAGRLARKAKRLVGGAKEEDYQKEARVVFEALSKLRGPALKLAQALSLELGWLPKAYQEQFQKANYQVPPLNRAVIRRLLTAEFGKAPEELFAEFEPEAFAAASFGQVHRAVTKEGDKVAVKVQYPGVQEALDNDMALAQNLLKPLLRSPYVNRVMKEFEARFKEEADYNHEFENTLWFHEHLKVDGVRVPRPYKDLSTARVLTTELMPGKHVEEWLAGDPSQDTRNLACQRIWNQFSVSLFVLKRMHADPNPGNVFFMEDGSIALVDFGCVKSDTRHLADIVNRYLAACLAGDNEAVLKSYAELGIDAESHKKLPQSATSDFDRWMVGPFLEDSFDFARHPNYAEKFWEAGKDTMGNRAIEGMTAETLMMDRNLQGFYNLFGRIGATIQMRRHWVE